MFPAFDAMFKPNAYVVGGFGFFDVGAQEIMPQARRRARPAIGKILHRCNADILKAKRCRLQSTDPKAKTATFLLGHRCCMHIVPTFRNQQNWRSIQLSCARYLP